jgi:N-acetyl-gamma-glutamyl-phosphate reductase
MARGLLATIRAPLVEDLDERGALSILHGAFDDEPFVEVVDGWPATKAVAGSNRAQVTARVDGRAGYLVCSCAIDNLGKGAAGQAVQNANLALGLEEGLGLAAVGVWP